MTQKQVQKQRVRDNRSEADAMDDRQTRVIPVQTQEDVNAILADVDEALAENAAIETQEQHIHAYGKTMGGGCRGYYHVCATCGNVEDL